MAIATQVMKGMPRKEAVGRDLMKGSWMVGGWPW